MPSLADLVPEIQAYQQTQQQGQQRQLGQLQQVGALQGILAKVQAQNEQQEMKGLLSRVSQQAGGDPAKMVPLLLQTGTPMGIKLAEGMKGLLPKPAEPYTLAPGAQRFGPDNKMLAEAPNRPLREQNPSNVARLIAEKNALPPGDPQHQVYANAIRKESETAKQISPTINISAEPPKGDFSKTGEEYLATLPVTMRNTVKGVANYEISPMTFAARLGNREKMLEMVKQYSPDYDDTQYANKRRAIAQFGSGPQGNTVRNLNVAIEHIDTLGRAADALKNGDFTPGNKVYNEVAKIFGKTPPNTFEAMRDIVANEVVKGTIGGINAMQDRMEAAAKIKASASPDQLKELMNGWTELMGGQVKGLEQQYSGSTGLKDFRKRYLTQRATDAIGLAESKAAPAGGSLSAEEKAELEALKKRFGR